MALINSLVKQVDLPVWEWLRFAPISTAAISSTCISEEETKARYLYFIGATFWRYDTKMDSWQQLATPNIAMVTTSSLKYASFGGYIGRILSGTSSTSLRIPSLQGTIFNGKTICITNGVGMGQSAIITGSTNSTLHDQGLITGVVATATNHSISDSLKRWEVNQWLGYQVRIVYGTGQSQLRKVIFNDANTLYFYDINYHQMEPWNNMGFSAVAPFAVPVTTAGLQAVYYIESTVVSLDTIFSPIPDASSSFVIESGGIFAFSSAAAAPFASFQYYDVISDNWITKTPLGGQVIAAYGTDFAIERTGQHGGIKYTGVTATSATTKTITKSSVGYVSGLLTNLQVRITSGTGIGQRYRIVGNTTDTLEISRPWDIQPNNTSQYEVWPNTDEIYLAGGGLSTLFKYSVEKDYWYTGNDVDYGQTINIAIGHAGQEPLAVSTGVRNTGGITVLSPIPVNGGASYAVGDLFNITTVGTIGKGRVESVSGTGVVTSVSLYSTGLGYTTGTKSTSVITGGGNAALTVSAVTVGTVGRITTAQNINIKKGDSIVISGCTEAAWNGTVSILAIDSLTTFDIITTAAGNMAATVSQGVGTIVDASKNWTINEHVGKIVCLNIAGVAPTTQIRRITGNTATTLAVPTIVAGANGTSRYVICQPNSFGGANQWNIEEKQSSGYVTSGTTASLTDTLKNWNNNQWAGYKFRIHAGTGLGNEIVITSNVNNTLVFTSQTFTVDTTTRYEIMDSFGLLTTVTNTTNAVLTDTTKNWELNKWAGRRVRITAGTGAGAEAAITSNSNNALTITGVFAIAPDTTSMYAIFEIPARGLATTLQWIFGTPVIADKGKYLWSARGGSSNLFDRYNINTGSWELAINTQPKTEIFTTGTMYAYDGDGGIIIHRGDVTSTLRTLRMDVNTFEVEALGTPPYAHGTPIIGSRMEMLTTEDGLTYLYVMRHTGQEMWRMLMF